MDRSLLHGHDGSERIVGLHPSSPGAMRVYRREGDRVIHTDEPWFPFFFLTDATLLSRFPRHYWIKELEGSLLFSHLCAFERWDHLWDAVRVLLQQSGITTASPEEHAADLDVVALIPDPLTQYFLQTGRTLFRGMSFSELHRLHVEPRFERDPVSPRGRRLQSILLTDCLGWEVFLEKGSERELLRRFLDTVRKRDPDLLQGPGFYRSTIPRFMELAEALGIELAIGRDSLVPFRPQVRLADASAPDDAPLWEIPGRMVLDLRADGPSLPQHRSIVAESHRPALHFFALSQIAPPAHGNIRFPGLTRRLEHLLLREYIRVKHSLPPPTPRASQQGDGRELQYTGLLGPVLECDLAGLYAREMLSRQITSRNDPLGALPAVLEALLDEAAEKGDDGGTAARQLLGTLLPYLQAGRTVFGDHDAAEALKEAGKAAFATLDGTLTVADAKLVSTDRERVIIVPPPGIAEPESEALFLHEIAEKSLPGTVPAVVGRFKKVICFRKQDLALLGYDGTCVYRVTDLFSPDLERFARTFLEGCTRALLTGDLAAMHRLYADLHGAISRRTWDIGDFARTEAISTSLQRYVRDVEEGKREKSAPFEVLLRTGRWLPAGTRVAYYVTQGGAGEPETPVTDAPVGGPPLPPGASASYAFSRRWRGAEEWDKNFPDEDTAHYLERLENLARRFAPFFEAEDHHAIFSADELFPFDPARITPITVRVQEERGGSPPPIHLGIWLDQ